MRKLKFFKVVIIISLLFNGAFINLNAQVTVGSNKAPENFSVLELISNSKSGLRLPQLTTAQRDALATDMAAHPTEALGLTFYNLDTDCEEFWNGTDWKSLCGSPGKAELTVDCGAIFINAPSQYFSNRELTTSHYLEVPVTVTKKGTYSFTVLPKTPNGYYYTASGEFLETGNFVIRMQGVGKPINYTIPENNLNVGDTVVLKNYVDSLCEKIIHINNGALPEYVMQCGTAKYNGVFKVNTPLDNTNTITITIIVTAVNPGAVAVIETDEVDGFKFISKATPLTAVGAATITLYGQGTPISAGMQTFKLSSNSATSTSTCDIKVSVVMKPKSFLIFGLVGAPGYSFAAQSTNNSVGDGDAYTFVKDPRNFGTLPSSTVQVENINLINGGSGVITPTKLASLARTNPNRPDAVFIFYDSGWGTDANGTTVVNTLNDFIHDGRPVLLFPDDAIGMDQGFINLVNAVFGVTTMTVDNTAVAGAYMFQGINHPILNGPFGDVRGKYWGDDASATLLVQNLPIDNVYLFSDSYDWTRGAYYSGHIGYTSFMHRTLPFVYMGDGGFLSHRTNANDLCCYPFRLDATNFPAPRPRYGNGTATGYGPQTVYNSVFFGNLLSWVIKYVEGVAQ